MSAANGGASVTLSVSSTTSGTLYNRGAQSQTFRYTEQIGSYLDALDNYAV